jgi:CRP/FNR family transcriptional regulator
MIGFKREAVLEKVMSILSLADFLHSIPYFRALDSEEIKRTVKETLEHSFAKGEVLFLEGEPCRGLYIVKTGWIRIFKSSPEGREQVLLTAGEGTTFNDVPVFDGGPNPASASALEPSTVYIIPRETLLSLVADSPVARSIIELFAARLRHLTTVVEDLSFRSVVSRLAKMLLDLAVAEGGRSPIPRLTQDEMATIVGSVRDVVGRALKALEKTNAIKIEGQHILVTDPEKLKEMGK